MKSRSPVYNLLAMPSAIQFTREKNFPFTCFVTTHLWACNILWQEKDTNSKSREPPEDDKVSDFLKNIRDSHLEAAKMFVCRSNKHKNNFTRAQPNKDANRTVGQVQTGGKDRKSNASSKSTSTKGTKWSSRCQKHIPQKWSGGKVGLGTRLLLAI